MSERYPRFRRAKLDGASYSRSKGAHRRRRDASFASQVIGGCLTVGVITFASAPQLQSFWRVATQPAAKIEADERSVYYPNCDAARAAGAAPIYRGTPGYREGMDGDGDGIACEPYR